MQSKYRGLKRNCSLFGMLTVLLHSVSWKTADVMLGMVELLFFLYLAHWLDPGKKQKGQVKLIFFCLFIVSVGFGGLPGNIVLKTVSAASALLAAMLYLYSIKIPILFDRKFIRGFFFSTIYCPFAYANIFWEKVYMEKCERIKRQKIINGIILTFVIVVLILTPLYAVGDTIFCSWTEIIIGWLRKNFMNFLAAIILGWIPAMLVYSYIRGLEVINVPDIPEKGITGNIDKYKMFFNLFSVRAILIGGTIVNSLFIVSQFAYFFEISKNYVEISETGHVIAILGALILNSLFLAVLTLTIKEKGINNESVSISSLNIYYALSISGVWAFLCWRYVIVVFRYGIKGVELLWGLVMLLLLVVTAWNIMGILYNYQKFVKILCYCIATLLLLFNICIPEYWIGKINVAIFYYKYDNHLLVNDINNDDISTVVIESQDLDIEYLKTLKEWSIPALLAIKNIPNYYIDSGQTMGIIAEEEIFKLMERDLTASEMKVISAMRGDERHKRLIMMLEEKIEYKLPGKKRIILSLVKENYSYL